MLVIYDCYQIGIGEKIHVVALATQILVGRCAVCRSRCFERLACYTLDIASKLLGILEGFGFHRLALFVETRRVTTSLKASSSSGPHYIGRAVKNILPFFYRDRLNTQSLLKEVRLKPCRYASKNVAKFRLFTGAQHTNGFRLAAIDSSTNN